MTKIIKDNVAMFEMINVTKYSKSNFIFLLFPYFYLLLVCHAGSSPVLESKTQNVRQNQDKS